MLNAGIFPAVSNVFLQLSKAELFLHFKKNVEMFPTFWKCRNISYIFPMCFCSCQKLNCSCILKMHKCFLHFGCRNISSIFKCVSAVVKSLNCSYILKMQQCFLHFGNAGIFLTFFKFVSAIVKS